MGRGARRVGAGGRVRAILFVAAVGLATTAHVGTSNASFEGAAGPYGVRVIVRTPGVIPGLAQTSVRITRGDGVEAVTVRPLRSDVGLAGAPPPDTARPVAGDPELYSADLWLMTAGSYSVQVRVVGAAGEGTVFVPVLAVAERRLPMHPAMGVGLAGAVLVLFAGAITVFGAAVRESVLEPGLAPDARRRRRGRVAMAVGGLALGLVLWGGWAWWDDVDAAYRSRIYRPWRTSSAVAATSAGPVLTVTIDDPEWRGRSWSPLVPDHGKLMHLFLVGAADASVFAHLHPVPVGPASFRAPLPSLPAGDYRLYADIVHETGFAPTLVDTVRVPDRSSAGVDPVGEPSPDLDDSWAVLRPWGAAAGDRYALPSGRALTWEREPEAIVADAETTLRFALTSADGRPLPLEPYIGMLGHTAIFRDDGSVFVHLHPSGSINLAAQQRFVADATDPREPTAAPDGAHHAAGSGATHRVAFPFLFPEPGRYRIVVQVKTAGIVDTAAFDLAVAPGRSS